MLTADRARELLHYNPETGVLIRRVATMRPGRTPKPITAKTKDGHLCLKIEGRQYVAHRLIFLMQTGRWPDPAVVHRNLKLTDNRWANLREDCPNSTKRI